MPRGLAQKTIDLRDQCYAILDEIKPTTVRSICYQLFLRKLIPDMSKNNTQRVSRILTQAREEGLILWDWIVDETRELERTPQWQDPAEFATAVRQQYRRDRWLHMPQRVEVWSEKGTMRGMLKPVLDRYGVGFRVMHGFTSATSMMEIVDDTRHDPAPRRVFYLGDWDPSGMHMSKVDIPQRLVRYGANVDVSRLALTDADIRLPGFARTSFAASDKRKDPRYRWFVDTIGATCWELDALNPVVLRDRVEAAIRNAIDVELWTRLDEIERVELASLGDVLDEWERLRVA